MRAAFAFLMSPRAAAVVLFAAAATLVALPTSVSADNCPPCGQFHCPGPSGGCIPLGNSVCIGMAPGSRLTCVDPTGMGACPSLQYTGQC
jgi:hypothetical protein